MLTELRIFSEKLEEAIETHGKQLETHGKQLEAANERIVELERIISNSIESLVGMIGHLTQLRYSCSLSQGELPSEAVSIPYACLICINLFHFVPVRLQAQHTVYTQHVVGRCRNGARA